MSFWKSWGLYINPCEINNSWNTAMDINRANDIIQETYIIDGNKITMTTSKTTLREISDE